MGYHFPPPGDLPQPGIEPASPMSLELQVDSFELSGKPWEGTDRPLIEGAPASGLPGSNEGFSSHSPGAPSKLLHLLEPRCKIKSGYPDLLVLSEVKEINAFSTCK